MIARVFGLALFTASLAAAACGSGGGHDERRTPSGARASCASDSDCAVSDRSGCCNVCPDRPFAIPVEELARQQNKCKTAECGARSDRIECPQNEGKDAYVAVCADGTCAAKKK